LSLSPLTNSPLRHCPRGKLHENRCACNDAETFNGNQAILTKLEAGLTGSAEHWYSCTPRFLAEKEKALKQLPPSDKTVFTPDSRL
jgi:hypothetical protein